MPKKSFNLDDPDPRKARFAARSMFELLAMPPHMRGIYAQRVREIADLESDLEASNEGNRTKWNGAIPRETVAARVRAFIKAREAGEGPALAVYQSANVWNTSAKHIHREFRAELTRQGKAHLLSNGKRGRPSKSRPR